MRFLALALALVLKIQLYHVSAFPPDPLELTLGRTPAALDTIHNPSLRGYECGNIFFTDSEVDEALLVGLDSVDKGYTYPQRYQGKLYPEAMHREYLLWPIKKGPRLQPFNKAPYTTFRIMFTRNIEDGIDVVAKTTTNDYTRCMRIGRSERKLLTSMPGNPNGYLCAHKFIADEFIQEYLTQALVKIREKGIPPPLYAGSLYPEEKELMLLPILNLRLHRDGNVTSGPYSLLVNKQGELIDVFIRGYKNNQLRCLRSRKPPKAPISDPNSKLFVPPPRSGFYCERLFIDGRAVEESAQIAKNHLLKGQNLEEYSEHPFSEPFLIFNILKDGTLYQKGGKGLYRLILTLDYRVQSVALIVNGKLKPCERKTVVAKKNHDTSDYLCTWRIYSHQQLVQAAEEACKKMNADKKYLYPAKYKGPRFAIDGPYFTYPVQPDGLFLHHTGPDRVVINADCVVVGALTTLKKRKNKKLVKCHRMDDGPLQPGFYASTYGRIDELRVNK